MTSCSWRSCVKTFPVAGRCACLWFLLPALPITASGTWGWGSALFLYQEELHLKIWCQFLGMREAPGCFGPEELFWANKRCWSVVWGYQMNLTQAPAPFRASASGIQTTPSDSASPPCRCSFSQVFWFLALSFDWCSFGEGRMREVKVHTFPFPEIKGF